MFRMLSCSEAVRDGRDKHHCQAQHRHAAQQSAFRISFRGSIPTIILEGLASAAPANRGETGVAVPAVPDAKGGPPSN